MIFDLPFPYAPDSEEPIVPEISSDLLQQLFSAAGETLKARPWKTLHDTDWFGIVDPDTGDTHIVAIMGAAKQFYAVQVYLPEEGIRFWNDFIFNGEPNITLGQFQNRMLSCEFVSWNEEDLDETDMARNEEHDLILEVDYLDSFLFRSTLPGCVNWHPTEEEARKLLDALRLVPRFLRQRKKLPQKCYDTEFGELIPWIPCYQLPENKDRRNADQWELTTVRFPEVEGPEPYVPDELFPTRIAAHQLRKGETWQIDSAQFGKAVMIGGRPTWLVAHLATVEQSGFTLGAELLPGTEAPEVSLRKSFLRAINEAGHRPEKLKVRTPLAKKVFEDVPGLTVILQDELPEFDQVIGHFLQGDDMFSEDHPLGQLSPEVMEQIDSFMASAPPLDQLTPQVMADLVARLSKIDGGDELIKPLLPQAEEITPFANLDSPAFKEMEFNATAEVSSAPASKSENGETGERFVLRIDLESFGPPVWRRLSISTSATFSDLHYAIQALFEWDNDHCHTFEKRKGSRIVSSIGPDDEYDDQSEYDTPLKEVFKRKGSKIHYVYDFGDKWTHLIRLEEKVKSTPGERGPACLAGLGIAPPEDCGGIRGWLGLLDPESGYAEEMDWDSEEIRHLREGKFDPKSVIFR